MVDVGTVLCIAISSVDRDGRVELLWEEASEDNIHNVEGVEGSWGCVFWRVGDEACKVGMREGWVGGVKVDAAMCANFTCGCEV